jgi:hypothetical protein
MRRIPDISRHCQVLSNWVQVIWLALPVTADPNRLRLVPISSAKNFIGWSFVEGVSVDYVLDEPGPLTRIDRIIAECLFTLNMPRCGARLVDLSKCQHTLRPLQAQHFERVTTPFGLEVFVDKTAAMNCMPSFERWKSDRLNSDISAIRKIQRDNIYKVHEIPLLLAITQPTVGFFSRIFQKVYRLHFVCPVCGRKGVTTGTDGDGFAFKIARDKVVKVQKCLEFTLKAIQILSLACPGGSMPHLADLASYLPNNESIVKFGVDRLRAEVERVVQANATREEFRGAVAEHAGHGAIGAMEVSLDDVSLIKDLISAANAKPTDSGLMPVWFQERDCAWVCKETKSANAKDCAGRFRREGPACLSIRAEKV